MEFNEIDYTKKHKKRNNLTENRTKTFTNINLQKLKKVRGKR